MWEGSTRRDRLPPDWPARRARVLARDGWQCTELLPDGTRCTARATDCDHIIRGDNHQEDNLAALCQAHHASKSGREGAAAKPTTRLPPEQHPGRL